MEGQNGQQAPGIVAPSLPKGGGAIQSIGKGWGAVGASGMASMSIPLPIAPGRGLAPSLGLNYSSAGGRSEFGQGWGMGVPTIARRSSKGVPDYEAAPEYVGPDGDVLLAVPDDGSAPPTALRGADIKDYRITRYQPRHVGDWSRFEHFQGSTGSPFWVVHGADGSLHLFGRRTRVEQQEKIAEWLLEETVTPNGEHMLYEYLAENAEGLNPTARQRDCSTRHYLWRVRYGSEPGTLTLFGLQPDKARTWLFDLIFDYGDSSTALDEKPAYPLNPGKAWPLRQDPLAQFRYGFEVRTLRLCRQVLMFNWFSPKNDGSLGSTAQLMSRLLFEYDESPLVSQLVTVHSVGYAADTPSYAPPLELDYTPFSLPAQLTFEPFFGAATPGSLQAPALDGPRACQMLDLLGDGLAGILCSDSKGWWYRRPMRASGDDPDAIDYAPWTLIERIPLANPASDTRQFLADLDGDGRLEWVLAKKTGLSGFFTFDSPREWGRFVPYAAFPAEFFEPRAQLADLMGNGLADLALVGSRSVRLYRSERAQGFAPAEQVPRQASEDALPVAGNDRFQLVAFADVLGTGQQHLVRVSEQEVSCWPNLGHGRFGARIDLDPPAFPDHFNPDCIRFADLDGSGAVDILYLKHDKIHIFMNRSGHGFGPGVAVDLPEEARFNRLSDLHVVDLLGIGCSGLALSLYLDGDNNAPSFLRCDLQREKPYLLRSCDNNMGALSQGAYRSSAQEWLDERAALADPEQALSRLPFAVQVVSRQAQLDQITGNRLAQRFTYQGGYYDPHEREFRGFARLTQEDSEADPAGDATFTAPVQVRTWFHVGDQLDPGCAGAFTGDAKAPRFAAPLCLEVDSTGDTPVAEGWADETLQDASRILAGTVLRSETWALGAHMPYSVSETRHAIRRHQARDAHRGYSVMQVLGLETRQFSYAYQAPGAYLENYPDDYRQPADDPQCSQSIVLGWDRYGAPEHSVTLNFARRAGIDAPFPPGEDYAHLRTWWQDAQDPAQAEHYLGESFARLRHVTDRYGYLRLGLPHRTQAWAYRLPREQLDPAACSFETFTGPDSPLQSAPARDSQMLAGQARVAYQEAPATQLFFGLVAYGEQLELDERALQAYEVEQGGKPVNLLGDTPAQRSECLELAGYVNVGLWKPQSQDDESVDPTLWAVRSGYPVHDTEQNFFRLLEYKPVARMAEPTRVEYDAHSLHSVKVTAPDGCVTQARYDYLSQQVTQLTDPNGNQQQALYDAAGRLVHSTFHGTEWDLDQDKEVAVGFAPLAPWTPRTPAQAIADPSVIGDMAVACFYAPCSWMGQADEPLRKALPEAVRERILTPEGYLRGRMRAWMEADDPRLPTSLTKTLREQLLALPREPVHSAVLQADRYPGDPERQVRVAVACNDGFGRALQSKQLVPPGQAWSVKDGELELEDGKPKQLEADPRWRVSGRVEYNNKGLAIRSYPPYFANSHLHIADHSLREVAGVYPTRQFYDPLGRPTVNLVYHGVSAMPARKGLRTEVPVREVLDFMTRATYWNWYSVAEDENDTADEMAARRAQTLSDPL